MFFCLRLRRPPRSTRTDTLLPYTTLFRSRPTESTIAVAHLLFSGVIERFPDLVICVVHGGGFIPYQVGRMQRGFDAVPRRTARNIARSEEHTSELQSLMRISYAVFCLKKKKLHLSPHSLIPLSHNCI